MPNKPSAKKRMRQNEKRRLRNKMEKRSVKTHIKNALALLQEKGELTDEVKARIDLAISKIDKAWKHGVFHKNKAARYKSRFLKKVNSLLRQKQAA